MSTVPPPPIPTPANPRGLVNGPGIGLLVMGGIAVLGQLVSLLFNLLGAGLGAGLGKDTPEIATQLMSGVVGVIFAVIGILIGGFLIYGGMQMRALRGYVISIIASILVMIPCFFPCCCPAGIPVGIWALVVLMKPEVKAAFVG